MPNVRFQNAPDDHRSAFEEWSSLSTLEDDDSLILTSSVAPSDEALSLRKRKRNDFILTTEQVAIVKLMKLLDDMNCPDYAFPALINWATQIQQEKVSFVSSLRKREANVRWMRAMLHNANCMLPEVVPTQLSPTLSVDVMRFSFVPQLLSLLQDPAIMVQENLVIDINHPIPMHTVDKTQPISEVLDCSAYKEAHKHAVAAHKASGGIRSLFVVPICCWGDATHIDQHGRFKLEPWSFTPLIFKEKARRKAEFWRVLGFANVLKLTTAERRKLPKGEASAMYHKQLQVILHHLHNASAQLKNVMLPIGPHRNLRVDIVCPLLYVIADTEGADKICGRYVCYSMPIARRCRVCNVTDESLSDPNCDYVINNSQTFHDTQQHGSKDDCRNLSVHQGKNAFSSINMGGVSNGIFTATPPDMLHVVRKGLMERLVHCILKECSKSEKALLDQMNHHFHATQKQRCKMLYPKLSFTSGFTNLSFVQAHEWVGILFLLVTLAQTDRVWRLLDAALKKAKYKGMKDALQVMEAFLCFDAWLHKDAFWSLENAVECEQSSLASIQMLMQMCIDVFPQEQWHVLKFHLLLHYPFFISKFGAPNNYDSQRPEHNHISHAKRPGRRAHKTHNGQKFEKQVAQRLADTIIINTMHERVNEVPANNATAVLPSKNRNGSNGAVCFINRKSDNNVTEVWQCKSSIDCPDQSLKLSAGVSACLFQHFDQDAIGTCTELWVNDHLYRCHPNYRREGPHYDWAIAKLSSQRPAIPCQIVAFVPVGNVNPLLNNSYVVLRTCGVKGSAHSALYEEWMLTDNLVAKPVSSIVRPCLTILLDETKVCVAMERSEWANLFTADPETEHTK